LKELSTRVDELKTNIAMAEGRYKDQLTDIK